MSFAEKYKKKEAFTSQALKTEADEPKDGSATSEIKSNNTLAKKPIDLQKRMLVKMFEWQRLSGDYLPDARPAQQVEFGRVDCVRSTNALNGMMSADPGCNALGLLADVRAEVNLTIRYAQRVDGGIARHLHRSGEDAAGTMQ